VSGHLFRENVELGETELILWHVASSPLLDEPSGQAGEEAGFSARAA
jgi:hypothetical protein